MSVNSNGDAGSTNPPGENKCNNAPITSGQTLEANERRASEPDEPHLNGDPLLGAEELSSLGRSHLKQFRDTGELNELEHAIGCFSRAVALTPDGHHGLAERISELGVPYSERYKRQGELADLDKVIEHKSHALKLTLNDNPDMPRRHANLGVSYTDRYRRLGQLEDLDKAIECDCHALEFTPEGHPDMPNRHANLGVSYNDRYERLGNFADLKNSIKCHASALTLTPDGHKDMWHRYACLGACYSDLYQRLGELADLEEATTCHSRALKLTPEGHPNMPDRYAILGASHIDRYQRLGQLADLEEGIECHSDGLKLTPKGHPYMPRLHASLGVSYTLRYRHLGDLADLEKAIGFHSRARELTLKKHPDMPRRWESLGVAYTDRYQRLGECADLEKAIECDCLALELTPDDHPEMPGRLDSRGLSYIDRYQRLGERADLDKAIEDHSRALTLTIDGHPHMSRRHANLGVSYTHRYHRLGELADLEKAIEHNSRALESTPKGHPDESGRHARLGASYTDRYRRLGEHADLEQSIASNTRAFDLTPSNHPEISRRHASLGVSYADRYQELCDPADLNKAIEYHSNALKWTPDRHPDMSKRHASLGMSYTHRYQQLKELEDIERALKLQSRALELAPKDHPVISDLHDSLGVSYTAKYLRLGELAALEASINHSACALALTSDTHPNLPRRHFNHALHLLNQYQRTHNAAHSSASLDSFCKASQLLTGSPRERFLNAFRWAALASSHSPLNPMKAYQTTIDLLPQFIWLGATTKQRYQDLSTIGNLAVRACLAAIQSSSYSLALEWLEHARCVVWNQSLMLRTPLDQLHASHPHVATRLETVANQLHNSSFETQAIMTETDNSAIIEKAGQERRRLATEYHSLLAQTRQIPGFEEFLQPVKAKTLMGALPHGPAIVLNCYEASCDALVIIPGHESISHLPLLKFSEEKAKQARSDLYLSLMHKRLRERGVRVLWESAYQDPFESMLGVLWTDIVEPVLVHLGYMDVVRGNCLPHITWCPTGTLSFLPLHAAGDYSQPGSRIFDYVVSSYTPTLSALLASTPQSLGRDCRVLAIGQAVTPGQNPLPGIVKELAHIEGHTQNIAGYSQLKDNQATTMTVLDAMEQHDWVHLACHAHQNVSDPTKSGFFLHDGVLDLSAINRRTFKNKGLAFLSACQTARGDELLPDEAIHLASGMLMAGYPSVIATMWSVVDDDAPFVTDKVYAQLMKDRKLGNGEAGRALHHAVAGLREKVGEKNFARWVSYVHIGT